MPALQPSFSNFLTSLPVHPSHCTAATLALPQNSFPKPSPRLPPPPVSLPSHHQFAKKEPPLTRTNKAQLHQQWPRSASTRAAAKSTKTTPSPASTTPARPSSTRAKKVHPTSTPRPPSPLTPTPPRLEMLQTARPNLRRIPLHPPLHHGHPL